MYEIQEEKHIEIYGEYMERYVVVLTIKIV